MRRLAAAAAVLTVTVVGLTSAAWGGSVRTRARAAPPPVTGARFMPLPALASALGRATALLSRRRGSHGLVSHAPQAVAVGSGTCFVGPGACSEHPCIVYTGASGTSAPYMPSAATPRPAKCSRATGMARVSAATVTVTAAPTPPVRSP